MKVAAATALVVALLSGCGEAGSDAGPPPGSAPSPAPHSTTTLDGSRPPAATPAELAHRTEWLPWATDGNATSEVIAMLDAFGRGEDWTGTLTASAFHQLGTDEWRLCWEILESYPVQCGTSVVLSGAPPAYGSSPQLFTAQIVDGSGLPSVELSDMPISVRGTFFADSALFVPA